MEKTDQLSLPPKVEFVRGLEIWPAGVTMKLMNGMYKEINGCIFGLSIIRILNEIRKGNIKTV